MASRFSAILRVAHRQGAANRCLATAAASDTTGRRALVFPGQGSQRVGMGLDIFEKFDVAKQTVLEAEEAAGIPLRELMFNGPKNELTSTENAQPAILTHSIAIYRVLKSEYGFSAEQFDYVLGHSLGEYSALVATEALTLAEAVKLVRIRGLAMKRCVDGRSTAMIVMIMRPNSSVEELEAEVKRASDEKAFGEGEIAALANINSKQQVVLSGTTQAVEKMSKILVAKQIASPATTLPVGGPFHSPLVAPAAEEMAKALSSIQLRRPVRPLVSNVTGTAVQDPEVIKELLVKQVTMTVRWYPSILWVHKNGVEQFWELGGHVLGNLLKREFVGDRIRSISNADEIAACRVPPPSG